MKRIALTLLFIIGLVAGCFAQETPKVKKVPNEDGSYRMEIMNGVYSTLKIGDIKKSTILAMAVSKNSRYKESCHIYLFIFNDPNLLDMELYTNVKDYEIKLSNGEIITDIFRANGTPGDSYSVDWTDEGVGIGISPSFSGSAYGTTLRKMFDSPTEASRYLFNQLALYDIEYIKLGSEITLYPDYKSSKVIKPLISALRAEIDEKETLPDVNNLDKSWVVKPATQSAQPSSKPAVAPKPAVTPKPAVKKSDNAGTEPTKKKGSFLLTEHANLKYRQHISRKDHIAPPELIYTPLAMVTSRDIPVDALKSIVEKAKGVKKCEITKGDWRGVVLNVTPADESFYLRVMGAEEMPCKYMTATYDEKNTDKITSLSFSYALPKGWTSKDVEQYGKLLSEDLIKRGVMMKKKKWEGSKGYKCYYKGHTISIMYDKKVSKWLEPHISILITYDKELL